MYSQWLYFRWLATKLNKTSTIDDPDIALLLTILDDRENRPFWDRVSPGTSSLKTLWRQWDRLQIKNGMLYRIFYAKKNELTSFICPVFMLKTGHIQLVIPKSLQPTVLKNFHDVPSACQLEADRMVLKNSTIFLLASNEIDNRVL